MHGPLGEVGAAVAGGDGSAALEKPFQEAVRRASPGMPPAPQSSSAAGPGVGERGRKRRGACFNRAARPSAGTGGLPPICGTRYMRRLPALIRLSGGLRRSGWTLLPSCGKRLLLEHGIPSGTGTDIFPREEISGNIGKKSFPIPARCFCREGPAVLPFLCRMRGFSGGSAENLRTGSGGQSILMELQAAFGPVSVFPHREGRMNRSLNGGFSRNP